MCVTLNTVTVGRLFTCLELARSVLLLAVHIRFGANAIVNIHLGFNFAASIRVEQTEMCTVVGYGE